MRFPITPYVIEQMAYDFTKYGHCFAVITDTQNKFQIKRVHPLDAPGYVERIDFYV